MRWSDNARDKYIAPELSLFTAADIPDMNAQAVDQAHNQAAFILNSALRGGATLLGRQLFFNAIRRTNAAFDAYGRARDWTLMYLEDPEGHELRYVKAIDAWEDTLGYTWQALQLAANGIKQPWFRKGDGSTPQRLNDLHNTAKHVDERIINGTLHEESPIGVWLTNDGLKSMASQLTYVELSELLDLLGQYSSIVRDPSTMLEPYQAWLDGLVDHSLEP